MSLKEREEKRASVVFLAAAIAILGAAALEAQSAAPQAPVKVQAPAAVRDKASAPKPGADAKQVKSIGKGKLFANTANTPDDTDSLWIEKIDVDGDGNVDEASLLWDDEDRVLYIYKEGTFACAKGGTGAGGMLIAVYGKGNTHGKPAGSGWWAADVDKSQCASEVAGIYGCTFDAAGASTACGLAVVDDKHDALVITATK
jgi:hypothetical protein